MQYLICLPSCVVRVAWLLVSLSTGITVPCSMCSMAERARGVAIGNYRSSQPRHPLRRTARELERPYGGQQRDDGMMAVDPNGLVSG